MTEDNYLPLTCPDCGSGEVRSLGYCDRRDAFPFECFSCSGDFVLDWDVIDNYFPHNDLPKQGTVFGLDE